MKRLNVSIDGRRFELDLDEQANIIDVIIQVERQENRAKYSLLHIVYNPKKKQFYGQIGINSYTEDRMFINLREEPLQILPDHSTVYISTKGPCISNFDPIISYKEFLRMINS